MDASGMSKSNFRGRPARGTMKPRSKPRKGRVGRYEMKYKKLKKFVKSIVFENAALCDQVADLQEKIIKSKDERKFLLRKLLHFQAIREATQLSVASSHSSSISLPSVSYTNANTVSTPPQASCPVSFSPGSDKPPEVTAKSKKKVVAKKKLSKETQEGKPKQKRKKMPTTKRLVQPIPLDNTGRPIFPIVLNSLTVYSLGEIVSERTGFHTEEYIFPAGFCSTRIYCSIRNCEQQCLYTCKVSDEEEGPKFEISAEDDPEHLFIGSTVDECHLQLLKAVQETAKVEKELLPQGGHFFGFSHPTILNLIQSCPGARKCLMYQWIKFEVCRPDSCKDPTQDIPDYDNNPAVSFEAFHKFRRSVAANPIKVEVQLQPGETFANLRALMNSQTSRP